MHGVPREGTERSIDEARFVFGVMVPVYRAGAPLRNAPADWLLDRKSRLRYIRIVEMKTQDETQGSVTQTAQDLKILAVETRLAILVALRRRTLCVGALASSLGLTQGAVSQHLRILKDADLLSAHRDGHFIHYRVNEAELARWRDRVHALLGPLSSGDLIPSLSGRGPQPDACSTRDGTTCRRCDDTGSSSTAKR
jgi:DNA-binding transcriptional ArsR family regulator